MAHLSHVKAVIGMKLTNKSNLPQALYDAVLNDAYSKQGADFSITELLKPPRQRALQIKHFDEIEEDVEDRLWALYGQVAHLILERANRKDLAEKRFFMSLGNMTISGQLDTLDLESGVLRDFKFTTVWGFMRGSPIKPEWIAQLNMQLELLRQNNLDAKELQIVGLLRDYQKSKAKESRYPKNQIAILNIPLWERAQTIDFIMSRMEMHINALKELPNCDAEETWAGRRCKDYCSVSQFCSQYQQAKKTGILNPQTKTHEGDLK